jgi:hypothetical protein
MNLELFGKILRTGSRSGRCGDMDSWATFRSG